MKNPAIYFLLLSLILFSCQKPSPLSGKIDLSGNEEWNNSIYLIQPGNLNELNNSFTGKVIDSVVIHSDGSFAFDKMPNAVEPIILELAVQKTGEKYLNKLENEDFPYSNYIPFIWQNGQTLEISSSINQFQKDFTFHQPTDQNAAIIRLKNIRYEAYKKYLQKDEGQDHHPEDLMSEEANHLSFQRALIDFAETTDHFLPAMAAMRWVSPVNDYERVPEFLVRQCDKWYGKNLNHPWISQLCDKGNRAKLPVLEGDIAPDFKLPLISGDSINIYSILGEQLTILDFWASWCAPCRKENKEVLVPLWEKYNEQGLQIIGYGLESSQSSWEKAVRKDGADRWTHSSHLQGDVAPLMDNYRLQTIPANYILDGEGKVVAKNLHGSSLVEFVDQYFK